MGWPRRASLVESGIDKLILIEIEWRTASRIASSFPGRLDAVTLRFRNHLLDVRAAPARIHREIRGVDIQRLVEWLSQIPGDVLSVRLRIQPGGATAQAQGENRKQRAKARSAQVSAVAGVGAHAREDKIFHGSISTPSLLIFIGRRGELKVTMP